VALLPPNVASDAPRFVDVVQQLAVTYDLYSMQPGELLRLLPKEFEDWK
jgi:hypothetical protein